jgi:hypothetical protein
MNGSWLKPKRLYLGRAINLSPSAEKGVFGDDLLSPIATTKNCWQETAWIF